MDQQIPVLSLHQSVASHVDDAVRVLNNSQSSFRFKHIRDFAVLKPPNRGWVSWARLETVLKSKRETLGAPYLIGILSERLENNWFSRSIGRSRISFITSKDWEFISELPLAAFLAYEIVENFLELLIVKNDKEEEWLFSEVVHTDQTRGCISDLCTIKPHISFKIRTGDICAQCSDVLRTKLTSSTIESLVSMLESVRMLALGRSPRSPNESNSLPTLIDSQYPFPIAYCFRAMRSEFGSSRKFLRMLELYEVSLKYLTYSLLACANESSMALPEDLARRVKRLRMPTLSPVHQVCFGLLKLLVSQPQHNFLSDFIGTVSIEKIEELEGLSSRIRRLRNDTRGHGFLEDEVSYQIRYEDQFSNLELLMTFLLPLARYRLIKPAGEMTRRRGRTTFGVKTIMGSNPLFEVTVLNSKQIVDTDCHLYDEGRDRFMNMYPWLMLDNCPTCHREMVFIYDRLVGDDAIMREYPSNHEQPRPDIYGDVKLKLSSH